jgi:hypothetical protein
MRLENARFGTVLDRPTGKLGGARNAARSRLMVLDRPERQPEQFAGLGLG